MAIFEEQIIDRFGAIPPPLKTISLRLRGLEKIYVSKIVLKANKRAYFIDTIELLRIGTI